MGNLVKALKIAGSVAEVIIVSSIVIELVEKYGSRFKKKAAASRTGADNNASEKQ